MRLRKLALEKEDNKGNKLMERLHADVVEPAMKLIAPGAAPLFDQKATAYQVKTIQEATQQLEELLK